MSAAAPEPASQGLVERVARASIGGAWGDLAPEEARDARTTAAEWLEVMAATGLAVVELPEARVLDESESGIPADLGQEISAPPADSKGYRVMGTRGSGGDFVELSEVGWRDLDYAERDALRVLAVVAEMRRLRAERQGGEPR